MKKLRWQMAQAYARLDRVVAGSLLATMAALLLQYGATGPWTAALRREQLAQAGALEQARSQRRAATRNDPALVAREKLLASLPDAGVGQLNEVLARIEDAARAQQIEIESATYQLSAAGAGGIESYSVSMPLKAGYPALRAFIRQSLAQSPGLALTNLAMSRPARTGQVIEARVEFSAYFRRPR